MTLPLAAILAFSLSFSGKLLADAFLHGRMALMGRFLGLQYSKNPGVAFSVTFPAPIQSVLITAALVLIVVAALYARTIMSRVAFGFIIGGALANVVDRLGDGFVTDYFQVGTFPIFNVADSFITIGVGILLLETILLKTGKFGFRKPRT